MWYIKWIKYQATACYHYWWWGNPLVQKCLSIPERNFILYYFPSIYHFRSKQEVTWQYRNLSFDFMRTFGKVESYENERVYWIYQWPSKLQETDTGHFSPVYTWKSKEDFSVSPQQKVDLIFSVGWNSLCNALWNQLKILIWKAEVSYILENYACRLIDITDINMYIPYSPVSLGFVMCWHWLHSL